MRSQPILVSLVDIACFARFPVYDDAHDSADKRPEDAPAAKY